MTMHKYKPLRAALLVYDVVRLTVLAFVFTFISPPGGGLFPYFVYLTPNALFPLMTLFIFIRLREYKNYLPLYLVGKIITVITFYIWGIISFRTALGEAYLEKDVIYIYLLLCSNFALSLGDLLSILGSWFLLSKNNLFRQPDNSPVITGENGGL